MQGDTEEVDQNSDSPTKKEIKSNTKEQEVVRMGGSRSGPIFRFPTKEKRECEIKRQTTEKWECECISIAMKVKVGKL